MSAIIGEHGLVYIDGTKLPLANTWSIAVDRNTVEQPVTFVCPADVTQKWKTRRGSFLGASGSISALYEETDTTAMDAVLAGLSKELLLYPDCTADSFWWEGNVYLQVSKGVPADDYVAVDYSFTSTGRMNWKAYLVHDRFTTDVGVGSVDGTDCEPIGTRHVTDSGNNVSISGGAMVFAGGTGTWGQTAVTFGTE